VNGGNNKSKEGEYKTVLLSLILVTSGEWVLGLLVKILVDLFGMIFVPEGSDGGR